MKKRIIIGIIIMLILLLVTYVTLVLTKVLPNPFLDTKDLVCNRENDYFDFILEEKVVIKFDNKAKIKEYEVYEIFKFASVDGANDYYELLSSDKNNLELDGKNVIGKTIYNIKNDHEYKEKTKKEMKKIYVEELYYNCN